MKLTFVSKYPSLDMKNWSGTEYFTAKSLEKQGCEMDYITGLEDEINLSVRIKSKLYGRNKKYWIKRSPEVGKGYARQVLQQMQPSSDIIFSPGTEPIAYLETNKPKVFYTDATFSSMIGYYDWFDNLSLKTIKEGMRMEQRAIDTCSLAIYASDWAAESAIKDFNAYPEKVKVVPLGANISTDLSIDDIKSLIERRDTRKCKILFMGVEWYRKGGDIVVQAVQYLNDVLKLPTELHIVGIDDLPLNNLPAYIYNHGRINKATPEGLKKIEDLISQSHFLFVPSRAEAYGLVFCEAMVFGVPCISTNTGGIPTIVKNDVNGAILEKYSEPKEYAEKIYSIFNDKNYYEELSLLAFHDYKTRLNWDAAGRTIMRYLREL